MLCQRCRGLLVRETVGDLREEAGIMCLATRCINCGSIEDSVVRANRLNSPATKRVVPRGIVGKGGVMYLRPHSERYRSI
jgi:RNase P subunit RPR2